MNKNLFKKLLIVFLLVLTISLYGCSQGSDEYPRKPITWIVPFGTGGGSDQFARMMENVIEKNTDVEIVVVNMPGANTSVGLNHLMSQDADGYTIYGSTTDSVINMVNGGSDYDLDDIIGLARIQYNIDMIFMNSDETRFTNFDSMIEYMQDNTLSIATTGLDGADATAIRTIEEIMDVTFNIVPYSEPGERYAALAGGHVDLLFEQPGDIKSFLDSEVYSPIISMSEDRITGFEDVPTSIENGINVTNGYWRGVWVKAGTNDEYVQFLIELMQDAIETEEYLTYETEKSLHLRDGWLSGDDFETFMENEYNYYAGN